MGRIGSIIYVVIGLIIAANKGYMGDISGLGDLINLLLAVVLWPLLLFGVHFNLHLGGKGDKKASAMLIAPALIHAEHRLRNRGASSA